MRLKVALRNTFRNKRRTLLNVMMIAGGVCAIVLFRGFADYILVGLREVTIKTQYGHLQVAPKVSWEKAAETPKDNLIKDYHRVLEKIRQHPRVTYASGRLNFYTLVSARDRSFSARALSFDPKMESAVLESFRASAGNTISNEKPFQVMVGSGLAKLLAVKPGDSMTALTYTYDGAVNALDLEVGGIFTTTVSEFDDTTFIMPLSSAQKLLDTEQVERVVVGLQDTTLTDSAREELTQVIGAMDPSVSIKSWKDLAKYYFEVLSFFRVQNGLIEFIIMTLVLLGILNTIGMSIFERTGEIGTLLALGETKKNVVYQFVLEGALLGLIGALSGILIASVLSTWINHLEIPFITPGASVPLKVRVNLIFPAFRDAVTLTLLSSMVAALVPAYRAAKMNIVDALKHNI